MFIPTKSGGRNSVNRREKREKNKENKKKNFIPLSAASSLLLIHLGFFICVGPTYHILFHFLVRFSSKTNHFVPVLISFIIIEYSLNICHFSRFFKNLVFRFHSILVCLEIRKIFRLSRNLTKFDKVARFRERNLTAQSVSSSEI